MNTWDHLPFKQKMLLVDYWTLSIIFANVAHIIGMLMILSPSSSIIQSQNVIIGCGTGLIWLSLTKYLQYNKEMYALPGTMLGAGRQILLALISSLPIFVGLAYFCVSQFGSFSWRFATLRESLIMLWATSNGDECQNVYHHLTGGSFLMGAIFCYGWIFFSNNCITPTFLALSEDGYIK
jgi:hypothetical protein